jgi:hypothetical protein
MINFCLKEENVFFDLLLRTDVLEYQLENAKSGSKFDSLSIENH